MNAKILIAASAALTLSSAAAAETLKFDFGVDTQQTADATWNNCTGPAGGAPGSIAAGAVVNTTGATPYGLDATGFGSDQNWGVSGAGANWEGPYPLTGPGPETGPAGSDMALRDGFYVRTGGAPSFVLTNLAPGSVWDLTFYGARGNNGGDCDYFVTGNAVQLASIAQVYQNSTAVAVVSGAVVPATGTLTIAISGGPDTDPGSLNALIMTSSAVSAYCFGDGSGAVCPCGNTAPSGVGCVNSTGSGALLDATGTASVAADDLVLHGTQLPPGVPSLFFMGNNQVNAGAGAIFGDGLLCAGGGIQRLQIVIVNGSGNASSTLPIASSTGATAGSSNTLQLWYRDPSGPCGGLFNTTNGLLVSWQ